ncbi:MAG: ABC transporter substrate-binding protein [Alphaproteobacteria bacterium]|nr:ABC transporter substrate-binding protein [Alphaproteobacteria bacterium]
MAKSSRPTAFAVNRREALMLGGAALAATASAGRMARAQTPKRGGTLRVSNGGDPPDYDVLQTATYLTQFVGAPCYSTLMRVDPADYSRLQPDLAERWEVSADGKTVTFHLRDGVVFHNGSPLTSADVVYSLERIRNPPRGIVSPRRGLLGNVDGIEAPGPRTVVVRLKAPQPDFLFMVSNPFNVIYSKAVAEPLDAQGTGMKRQIMGTGPFRLGRAVNGQIYEFERFDRYYGGPAHLDKIQMFPIRGEIERGAALQGRRIDASFFFANESVLQNLRQVQGMTALRRPTPTFINLIPQVEKKPFDDVRVREALSLALDRDAFIKTVGPLAGAFFHSMGLLPPGSPHSLSAEEIKQFGGYDTLPGLGGNLEANRRRARELLRAAGVPEGFKVSLLARGDIPAFRDSSINIAAQLKNIGLDATVDVRDAGAFYTLETTGQFELVAHSVAIAGSLPDQILGEGYTSFGGRNYGKWRDDSLDTLYRQQSSELDPAKRGQLIKQFQLAFLKTYYQINLAWVGYGAAHSNTMKGWTALPDLYANMNLHQVWLDA